MSGQEKKNREAIRRGFPELYQRLQSVETIRQDFWAIEHMETLTDTPALVVAGKDESVYRLESAYSPEHEAEVWCDAQDVSASSLFMLGLGNGSFAKAVYRKKKPEAKLLVYEPSAQLFLYAMEHLDLSFFFQNPDIRVIIEGVNDNLFSGVMEEMLTYENMESRSFLCCPYMGKLFPESRSALVSAYVDGVGRMMSNKNTIGRFLHISPFNQLYNLRFLKENTVVPRLAAHWEGDVPVVIAGAGPSLKKDLDVIVRERDKIFLFVVDSALPYLLSENVVPDAFICIEADKPVKYFADERALEIPLFTKMNATWKLLSKHKGKKIFGCDEEFVQEIYQKCGVPLSTWRYGGNGATSFFAICRELGVKNVILTGQDMAYGESRESHVFGRHETYVEEEKFLLESNAGEKVQSRQDWYRFMKWYENAIPACGFSHVVNTAEHGLKIKGAPYMTIEEAIDTYGHTHNAASVAIEKAASTFEGGRELELSLFYDRCERELEELSYILAEDPQSEKRKEYAIYSLLSQYEIAGSQETLCGRQRAGWEALKTHLDHCREENI